MARAEIAGFQMRLFEILQYKARKITIILHEIRYLRIIQAERSRIEAQMNRLKLLGDRIVSRDPERQVAEVQIRIAIMNRCSAMGMAEIERVK